jgi:hypothetical protein
VGPSPTWDLNTSKPIPDMGDTSVPVDASLTQYRELSLLSPNYGRGPASTRRVVDVDLLNGGIVEESVEFGVELSSIDRDRVDHHAAAIEGPNGQLPNGELFWKICEITRGVARVGVQENRARRPVGGVDFRINGSCETSTSASPISASRRQ